MRQKRTKRNESNRKLLDRKTLDRKKLILPIAIIGIVLLCIAGFFVVRHLVNRDKIVCYVDKQPVYHKEFMLNVDRIKMYQQQELAKKQGKEMSQFSWEDKIGNKTGYEWLAEAAIEQVVSIKVMQKEALRLKITDKIDYPTLMKRMNKENEERIKTKKNNGVVFGVTEYTEEQYYDYYNENLNIKTKSALIKDETLLADREEIEAVYQENQGYFNGESFETVENSARILVLDDKYEAHMERLAKKAEVDIPDTKMLVEELVKEMKIAKN